VTPFRQLILPGAVGSDVWAVKRAYTKMGVKGAGALARTKQAGPAFVAVTKTVQQQNHLKADGVYGEATHLIVALHFDAYGTMLYRTAKIRNPPQPAPASLSAQAAAKKLLAYHDAGDYHADNPGDLRDIEATAAGKAVWSQGGYWVHIDPRPLDLLVYLISMGHKIGTYAICSDHHNDGPHGHAGGLAVDIVSIDGHHVADANAKTATLQLGSLIQNAPGLRPRQLISGGYGNREDADCKALCIPFASFYGEPTLSQHCNHIHCGF
jgi:hypothetical protein